MNAIAIVALVGFATDHWEAINPNLKGLVALSAFLLLVFIIVYGLKDHVDFGI